MHGDGDVGGERLPQELVADAALVDGPVLRARGRQLLDDGDGAGALAPGGRLTLQKHAAPLLVPGRLVGVVSVPVPADPRAGVAAHHSASEGPPLPRPQDLARAVAGDGGRVGRVWVGRGKEGILSKGA